jgi:ribosomal protein S6--L-glutamate ligase
MRLFFLLAGRVPPVPSPILVEVFERLRRKGFDVDGAIADEFLIRPDGLLPEHDLYLLKSHTELSLSVAGVLHAQGARLLNPYVPCITTQDKIVASRHLSAAGVPTPRSWVVCDYRQLVDVVATTPLVVKPHRGHRGTGISVVRSKADLLALSEPDQPMLIQEYVEGTGEDLKLYVVGDEVFGVRKPFSPTSFTEPGRPCRVDAFREIAIRAGEALGLGLFGVDVIEASQGPYVVDVNYFPGYKGVPYVAPLIADYIADYASGERVLPPPRLDPAGEPDLASAARAHGVKG